MVKCKLLVQNRDILKNEFQWASTNMIPLCAYYFTERGRRVDAVRMKECKQIIKRNVGVLTKAKGDDGYPLAAMLALEENVNKAMDERVRVYQTLSAEYEPTVGLTMIAFILAKKEQEKGIKLQETMERAIRLEEMLDENEGVLPEERSLFLLLALSEKEEQKLIDGVKAYYDMLEDAALTEQARKICSMLLVLGNGKPEEQVHKLKEASIALRRKQLTFGEGIEAAALALVAVSEGNLSDYVEKIARINQYLKGQKGFDSLHLAANERLMYAVLLATAEEKNELCKQITLVAMYYSVIRLAVFE